MLVTLTVASILPPLRGRSAQLADAEDAATKSHRRLSRAVSRPVRPWTHGVRPVWTAIAEVWAGVRIRSMPAPRRRAQVRRRTMRFTNLRLVVASGAVSVRSLPTSIWKSDREGDVSAPVKLVWSRENDISTLHRPLGWRIYTVRWTEQSRAVASKYAAAAIASLCMPMRRHKRAESRKRLTLFA